MPKITLTTIATGSSEGLLSLTCMTIMINSLFLCWHFCLFMLGKTQRKMWISCKFENWVWLTTLGTPTDWQTTDRIYWIRITQHLSLTSTNTNTVCETSITFRFHESEHRPHPINPNDTFRTLENSTLGSQIEYRPYQANQNTALQGFNSPIKSRSRLDSDSILELICTLLKLLSSSCNVFRIKMAFLQNKLLFTVTNIFCWPNFWEPSRSFCRPGCISTTMSPVILL